MKALAVLAYIASIALAIGFAYIYSSSMDHAATLALSFVTGLVFGRIGGEIGHALWDWND